MLYIGISAYEEGNRPHCYNCMLKREGKTQILLNYDDTEGDKRTALFLCDDCLKLLNHLLGVWQNNRGLYCIQGTE